MGGPGQNGAVFGSNGPTYTDTLERYSMDAGMTLIPLGGVTDYSSLTSCTSSSGSCDVTPDNCAQVIYSQTVEQPGAVAMQLEVELADGGLNCQDRLQFLGRAESCGSAEFSGSGTIAEPSMATDMNEGDALTVSLLSDPTLCGVTCPCTATGGSGFQMLSAQASYASDTDFVGLFLPGQYHSSGIFGMTGMNYNWNRYFAQGEPIYTAPDEMMGEANYSGVLLSAGITTSAYSYGHSNPETFSDPTGREKYICTKPLDVISGPNTPPSQAKSSPNWGINPLYHRYICTVRNGIINCGSITEKHDGPYGPGVPSHDVFNPQRCKKSDPDNDCLETCLGNAFGGPRPPNRPR